MPSDTPNELRVRKLLHRQSGAAGVIEMHMGQDHPVDRVDAEAFVPQRIEQARNRLVGADINESGTAVVETQGIS